MMNMMKIMKIIKMRYYFTHKSLNIKDRIATIYKPSKNSMQSGDKDTKKWKLEFNVTQKWENPLIGWASG